jgi:hypothetical protein
MSFAIFPLLASLARDCPLASSGQVPVRVIVQRVGVTLHGLIFIVIGLGCRGIQSSILKLLVLDLLFQFLELLPPKLPIAGFAFLGTRALAPICLALASGRSLPNGRLFVFWEVLPLLVSVPVILSLVCTHDIQGCNLHLHVCCAHTLLHKVFVKGDTTGKIHAEGFIQDDSALNRIKDVGFDPRVEVTNLQPWVNTRVSMRSETCCNY